MIAYRKEKIIKAQQNMNSYRIIMNIFTLFVRHIAFDEIDKRYFSMKFNQK